MGQITIGTINPSNPYNTLCPACREPAQSSCRCNIGEKMCRNGHRWLKCPQHGEVALSAGANLHAGPSRSYVTGACRCPARINVGTLAQSAPLQRPHGAGREAVGGANDVITATVLADAASRVQPPEEHAAHEFTQWCRGQGIDAARVDHEGGRYVAVSRQQEHGAGSGMMSDTDFGVVTARAAAIADSHRVRTDHEDVRRAGPVDAYVLFLFAAIAPASGAMQVLGRDGVCRSVGKIQPKAKTQHNTGGRKLKPRAQCTCACHHNPAILHVMACCDGKK